MKHLKHEIVKELHDFDAMAKDGKLSYHDLEYVHLLSESYLKLCHVWEKMESHEHNSEANPMHRSMNNPKEY